MKSTTATTTLLALLTSTSLALGNPSIVRSQSSCSSSESVTVTSDGSRTIKKTVSTRDGVTTTRTEITDADGKVTTTTTTNGAPARAGHSTGGRDDGPWMGLRTKEAAPELRDQLGLARDEGLVVEVVAPDGPAAKAGLREHDLILSVDGQKTGSVEALRAAAGRKQPGDTVEVVYLRKGTRGTAQVGLERRPAGGQPEDRPGNEAGQLLEQLNREGRLPGIDLPTPDNPPRPGGIGSGIEAIEDLLDDPNVPAEMKDALREMKQRLQDAAKGENPPR